MEIHFNLTGKKIDDSYNFKNQSYRIILTGID